MSETGTIQTYRYDGFGRLVRLADSIPGDLSMVTQYTYDSYGRNNSVTYPSGITLINVFDANNRGYVNQIMRSSDIIWQAYSSNNRGQPVRYYLGDPVNDLQVNFTYDTQGSLASEATGQMKQTYSFDPASGNLTSRDYRVTGSQTGLTEDFTYDNLNRLLIAAIVGGSTTTTAYSDNGNIASKSNAGTYLYDQAQINAVVGISGYQGPGNQKNLINEYNSFNLTTNLSLQNPGDSAVIGSLEILYNPVNQRIKTECYIDSTAIIKKYYSNGYEKTDSNGVVKEAHYIYSPFGLVAVIVKRGAAVQTYYVETDHLGSIIGLINPNKTYADRASFDPWGRRRNPDNWSYNNIPNPAITDRGFTGHEHLDQFGLINMNGRMYDPVLARFLGVDPVIQSPDYSQSYNGYSYCFNNPLGVIDPSGYEALAVEIPEVTRELSTWSLAFLQALRQTLKDNPDLSYLQCFDIVYGNTTLFDIRLDLYLNSLKTGTPWMEIAKHEIGQTEWISNPYWIPNPQVYKYFTDGGFSGNPVTTPWCVIFINYCLQNAGIRGLTGEWRAHIKGFEDWGVNLQNPAYGAIAILNTEHAGFVWRITGNTIYILGGNQSNAVSISPYSLQEVKAYYYPHGYKPVLIKY